MCFKSLLRWSGMDLFVRGGLNVFCCLRAERIIGWNSTREKIKLQSYISQTLKLATIWYNNIPITQNILLSIFAQYYNCYGHFLFVNPPLMGWFTSLWIIIISFRNVFIANLAVSDLCLCLVTMPLTLVEVQHHRHDYRHHLHDPRLSSKIIVIIVTIIVIIVTIIIIILMIIATIVTIIFNLNK